MSRYLSAEKRSHDDFNMPFGHYEGEVVYDAATTHGRRWATMTEVSFKTHGLGKLGTGWGQKYVRNAEGELHKVEG